MTQISDHDKQRLRQAATLIENGNVAEAKTLLAMLRSAGAESAPFWSLVSFTVETPDQKRQALTRALALDPNYQSAQHALAELPLPSTDADPDIDSWFGMKPRRQRATSSKFWVTAFALIAIMIIIIAGCLLIAAPSQLAQNIPITPTITLTPSQTPPPSTLNLTSSSGQAELRLYSGLNDPIAQQAGNFVIKGTANLFFDDNTLSINVKDETKRSAEWSFQYFAPDFQANLLYANAVNYTSKDKTKPHLDISSPYGGCDSTTMKGDFVVEQQSPTVIVSFTHLCPGVLRGVMIFTPDALTTPTPSPP